MFCSIPENGYRTREGEKIYMKTREWFDVHADDYGVSLNGAEDILQCIKEGALDSFSVIPNMSCFDKCVERYSQEKGKFVKKPLITVHLNIMDGKPLLKAEEVPDLVDEDGFFILTWGKLLFLNYSIGKKKKCVKEQLKKEFLAQIEMVEKSFGVREIRLDSHQHPHMIPFVFDVLMEICDEKNGKVTFVRVAKEPLLPFILCGSLYLTYNLANLVKNLLLNIYSVGAIKKLRKKGLPYELMWGLVMSGYMDEKRIKKLLLLMQRSTMKKKKKLEILFHPGLMLEKEKTEEYRKEGFYKFYCSENRLEEKKAVMSLKNLLKN